MGLVNLGLSRLPYAPKHIGKGSVKNDIFLQKKNVLLKLILNVKNIYFLLYLFHVVISYFPVWAGSPSGL